GDLEMLLARARDVSPSKLSADAFGALKALRELGSSKAELFEQLARSLTEANQRNEAIAALTASTASDAHVRLLNLWPDLSQVQRRATLSTLAGNKSGAQSILDAI